MTNLVSIIMPVYNSARFVDQAIQSVLDQTYPHWELLIVNDGSTDDSVRHIMRFKDERISVFHQDNKGVSSARNVALARMKGEYFCFLDADDVLTPHSIEVRLNLFQRAITFVDGAVDLFDANMKQKEGLWVPGAHGSVLKRLFRLNSSCFMGLTWMVKKQTDITYQFDECLTHCEDLLFFMSIAHSGDYAFTTETVLRYRRAPGSAMRNIRGLANGYTILREKMHTLFPIKPSLYDKIVFDYKVRKIVFLSYVKISQYRLAVSYLVNGRL